MNTGWGRPSRDAETGGLRIVGIAVLLCAALSLTASCSTGGGASKQSGGDADVDLTDPCEPACCCRVKDNYYVRFNCSGRAQCMAQGGTCTTDEVAKCRTDTQSDANLSLQRDAASLTFESAPAHSDG